MFRLFSDFSRTEQKKMALTSFTYGILLHMELHDKPSPRGILFDMDGVLLVTNQSPAQSWREVFQQFAPTLDISLEILVQAFQESRDAYKCEIEYNAEEQRRDRLEPFETRQETVESTLKALNKGDKSVAVEMVHIYEALREAHLQLAPHALEVLQELRKRGLPLALISNGNATYQRRKITQHRLSPFFDSRRFLQIPPKRCIRARGDLQKNLLLFPSMEATTSCR